MKSVLEYLDYHAFIRETFAERKARTGFTWREFAKLAGYASPVYLKLVADGKSTLSELGIERVATALGITGKELLYFRLLVRFNHTKESDVRKALLAEMRTIATSCQVTVLGSDQYDYFSDWHNPTLRELAAALPTADASRMATLLRPTSTPAKVRKSLALLRKLGLLEQDESGSWKQTDRDISTGNEVASLAVRDMHRQMGELGVSALETTPVSERDISGMTLGLSAQGFARAQEELREFRRRLREIAQEDAPAQRVYRMNLQLFPLTDSFATEAPHA